MPPYSTVLAFYVPEKNFQGALENTVNKFYNKFAYKTRKSGIIL